MVYTKHFITPLSSDTSFYDFGRRSFLRTLGHVTPSGGEIQKKGSDTLWTRVHIIQNINYIWASSILKGGDSAEKWPYFQLCEARDLDLDLG